MRLPVETKVADEVVDLIDMEVVYLQFLLEEKRARLVVSLFIVDLSLNCALGRDGEELENEEKKNKRQRQHRMTCPESKLASGL